MIRRFELATVFAHNNATESLKPSRTIRAIIEFVIYYFSKFNVLQISPCLTLGQRPEKEMILSLPDVSLLSTDKGLYIPYMYS